MFNSWVVNMNCNIIRIDSMKKYKMVIIFEVIIGIISIVSLIICNVNLINNITLNIISTILTIIVPFILGIHCTKYNSQREAINELSEVIIKLWDNACELEKDAQKDNDGCQIPIYLQKEVSIFYIFAVYFDNLHWYNHELYNLPIDIKEMIKEFCTCYQFIDYNLTNYKIISYIQFKDSCYYPINFEYSNTQFRLKKFFEIVIKNTSEEYSKDLENIKKIIIIPNVQKQQNIG